LLHQFFQAYANQLSAKEDVGEMLDLIIKLLQLLVHIVKTKHFEHENEYRLV